MGWLTGQTMLAARMTVSKVDQVMAPLAAGKQVTGRKLPYCAFMRPCMAKPKWL